ncbi:MAG TPA: hypothetical protein VK448_02590 [Dissulfurispiraceae bacterium]|nr:hypothetical protein [Dissulfurispiraceae bacterium]
MKIGTILSIAKRHLLFLTVMLAACAHQASVEEISNEWISRPIDELRQQMKNPNSYASKIGWQEKTYPLANGYYAFVEPVSEDCYIYWRVNQRDIIVDARSEGKGCKQSSDSNGGMERASPKKSMW